MSEMTKSRSILSLGRREKGNNRTKWNFKFWCQLDGLSDLRYTARSRVELDTVEMEDEYWRKRLDENLPTCVAQTGRANVHGLLLGEACEGILNSAYRVVLRVEC